MWEMCQVPDALEPNWTEVERKIQGTLGFAE
jgi:hypothetical protein